MPSARAATPPDSLPDELFQPHPEDERRETEFWNDRFVGAVIGDAIFSQVEDARELWICFLYMIRVCKPETMVPECCTISLFEKYTSAFLLWRIHTSSATILLEQDPDAPDVPRTPAVTDSGSHDLISSLEPLAEEEKEEEHELVLRHNGFFGKAKPKHNRVSSTTVCEWLNLHFANIIIHGWDPKDKSNELAGSQLYARIKYSVKGKLMNGKC